MTGLRQGLIQVYTGAGKGKSTAAFGLALRAAGWGLKVVIVQFLKVPDCGEHQAFRRLAPDIQIKSFGHKGFIYNGRTRPEDCEQAVAAFKYADKVIQRGQADVLILDEINVAIELNLLQEGEVLAFLKRRPRQVEIILTGRNAPAGVIEAADLVTEMVPIKHPYEKGIKARKGIEY